MTEVPYGPRVLAVAMTDDLAQVGLDEAAARYRATLLGNSRGGLDLGDMAAVQFLVMNELLKLIGVLASTLRKLTLLHGEPLSPEALLAKFWSDVERFEAIAAGTPPPDS